MNVLNSASSFFRNNPLSYWFPRLLGILGILLFTFMSMDAFTQDNQWWENIIGFMIHMIPAVGLAIILYFGWKNALYGGILFNILGVVFTIFFGTWEDLIVVLIVSFPMFVIGELFLYNWYKNKPNHT